MHFQGSARLAAGRRMFSRYRGSGMTEQQKVYPVAEEFAANLGCSNLRFASTVHMGGAAPVASLQVASAAIEAGMADYVLLPAGWNGYSGARVRQTVSQDVSSIPGGAIARDYYIPHGFGAPPQWYSIMARRHMHEFGTRDEHLGAIARGLGAI